MKQSVEKGPFVSSDLTRLVQGIDLDTVNRCADAYEKRSELGGCFVSTEKQDEVARAVSQALLNSGFKPDHDLRKDFGTWSQSLSRGDQSAVIVVDTLEDADTEGDRALRDQGFKSFLEIAVVKNDVSGQAGASVSGLVR
ncbi:hypothetical protein [Deinococcus sp.]|uniref:hypothetical protein n=1 Tax=Deinococcus sp. TaxID=47478 RepID=UPI0025B8ABD3|nr:hypothetical protein [Deinococcus sp.]